MVASLLGETVHLKINYTVFAEDANGELKNYDYSFYDQDILVGSGVELSGLQVSGTYYSSGYLQTLSGTVSADVGASGFAINFTGTQQPAEIRFTLSSLTDESAGGISGVQETSATGFMSGVNAPLMPGFTADGTVYGGFNPYGYQPDVNLNQSVSISLLEQTNDAPVITSNGGGTTAAISVSENLNSPVTTVAATDVNSGDSITYKVGGTDAALFNIEASSGVLTFKVAPDYETPADAGQDNIYDVTVTASDGTDSDAQDLAITVTDANDNAPVITSNGGGATAAISVAENLLAVTTVVAADADASSAVSYAVTGDDAALFDIDAATGVLSFKIAPDHEAPADVGQNNIYEVAVTASDGASSDTQDLAITVTDANDNAPVITSNGGGVAVISVAENQRAVTTVIATDADASSAVSYVVTGDDAALFDIDAATGVLSFKIAPDHEAPADVGQNNIYEVAVTASDGASSDTQDLAITVTDANDNAPVITSNGGGATAAISVAENQLAVTTVAAADADASSAVSYAVTGDDAALFDIDAATGVLSFKATPDYERPHDVGMNNIYDVVVTASDSLNNDNQSISISVTNVSDIGGGTPPPTPTEPTNGDDIISGGTRTDPIYGAGGSDTISATPAAGTTSQVYGGTQTSDPNDGGDHIAISGSGSAVVYGNGGDDIIDYTATGSATIYAGANNDVVTVANDAGNILVGGKGSDQIAVTGNGSNLIYGGNAASDPDDGADIISVRGNGSNQIYTNGGDDIVVITGNGNNSIYLGMGNDTATGGSGNEVFSGGQGANVYTGGGGADTFVYTAGASDIITDFKLSDGDHLDINGASYTLTTASDGSAALLFDGGGVIILQGVTQAAFSGEFLV